MFLEEKKQQAKLTKSTNNSTKSQVNECMCTLDFPQCDQLISACLCAVSSVQELTDLTLRAVHARAACAVLLATPSVQDGKLPIPFPPPTSHDMIYMHVSVRA